MELVAVITGAYKLGRALLARDTARAESLGTDLAAQFLRELLPAQNGTLAALARIEATVERAAMARHREAMEFGWRNLLDAARMSGMERTAELEAAARDFRVAASSALSEDTRLTAHMLEAMSWAAAGREAKFDTTLGIAAGEAWSAMTAARGVYWLPGLGEVRRLAASRPDPMRLLTDLFVDDPTAPGKPAMNAARTQLRREARERRDSAADRFAQVQKVRVAYGVDPAACAPVIGFYEAPYERLSPQRPDVELGSLNGLTNVPVLDWPPGRTLDVDGLRVQVTQHPVISAADASYTVRVGLELTTASRRVLLSASAGWPQSPVHATGLYQLVGARALTASGRGAVAHWPGDRVRVGAGERVQVELVLASAAPPTALVLAIDPGSDTDLLARLPVDQ